MTTPIIHETVTHRCPHCGESFRTSEAFRSHASEYRLDVDASCHARLGKLMCKVAEPFKEGGTTGCELYGTIDSCNPCRGTVTLKGVRLNVAYRSPFCSSVRPVLTVSAWKTYIGYQEPESINAGTVCERISGETDRFIRELFRTELLIDDGWDAPDLPFRATEDVERTFICPECGVRFPTEEGFRTHLRSCPGKVRDGNIEGTSVVAESNAGIVYGRIVGRTGPRHINVRGVNVDIVEDGDVEIYMGTVSCETASARVVPESELIRRCSVYAMDRALAVFNREVSV